ncbi:hypothetical protein [Chitinophaga sp.]|uniref:hypothetical protein n=1 Tax=Chitinophaga sp. TaxID=1869181 RepID=UPI0031DDF0B9
MIKQTSWLFAAAMLAGTSVHAQVKETKKPAPPVIEKHTSPSAKPEKTPASKTPLVEKDAEQRPYKIKKSELKPATRAKIERDGSYKNLTAAEKEEIRRAVRPPLKEGDVLPPPPPALPKKKN